MRYKRYCIVNILLFLLFFLSIHYNCSAEISLTIIGEEEKVSKDLIAGLSNYLPPFNHTYYNYKNSKIKNLQERLSLNYLPLIIFDAEKLDDSDREILKEKRLTEKKGEFLLFSFYRLRYLTDVHLLNRKNIPNELGIFTMSLCPYGQRAESEIIRFLKENNLPIKLKLYFIADIKNGEVSSMHGVDEVEENIHQILIQEYWPRKFYDYLLLTENISRFQALKKAGISFNKIDSLREKGESLLRENIKVAQELGVYASPTFLWENEYLISGLDNIIKILEKKKIDIYKETHPIAEYTIVGIKDYDSSDAIFSFLNNYFRTKGNFMSSSLAEKYIAEHNLEYIPFVAVKKSEDALVSDILKNKLKWGEKGDKFIMPKEEVLKISPLYYPQRGKESNRIDIISNAKDLKRFKDSSFIKLLINSGINVYFHAYSIFKVPQLCEELGIRKRPLILWENQYCASDFKQLFSLPILEERFVNLKTERRVFIDFFSSPSCKFCEYIKVNILPRIEEKYKNLVEIITFNSGIARNYDFLLKMEDAFNSQKPGVPKVFIGGKVLTGKNEIENNLELEVLNALVSAKEVFDKPKEIIKLKYFYNSAMLDFNEDESRIYNEIVPLIQKRYLGFVDVSILDTKNDENKRMLLEKTIGLDMSGYQKVVVVLNDKILQGVSEIRENIDRIIQEQILYQSGSVKEGNTIVNRLKQFTLPAIIAAGLLDGINPCAFTVIVFFISFLTMAGYRKREMFHVGNAFIFAVFLTYLLIGMGLFSAFYELKIYSALAAVLKWVLIAIVFLLAILNLYDFIIYKLKKTSSSVVLKLPQRIKFMIQKTIGYGYRKDAVLPLGRKGVLKLIFIAYAVGFIVSVLESVCTGQVYFPTVAFITQLPGIIRVKAFGYLILYNLMFVIPLFVIFLLGLYGVGSDKFAQFLKKHIGKIKLLTAVLFIFLAYILILLY